jgi:putative acetyltransferase
MTTDWIIVNGSAGREDDIASIIRAAFEKEYGSGEGEAKLVAALRADGDVVVELTALSGDDVVGHVVFSRLGATPDTLRCAALAPVTARIDRQKSGIGSALIRKGLTRCASLGCDAVAVLGEPEYYGRFGFTLDAAKALQSEFSGPHFQALELRKGALSSGPWKVIYPPAFSAV